MCPTKRSRPVGSLTAHLLQRRGAATRRYDGQDLSAERDMPPHRSKPAKYAGSSCAGGLDAAACVRRTGVVALECRHTRVRDPSRPQNAPAAEMLANSARGSFRPFAIKIKE